MSLDFDVNEFVENHSDNGLSSVPDLSEDSTVLESYCDIDSSISEHLSNELGFER